MIPSTTESLLFYWVQSGEHPAEHLFTVDERGCVVDVVTASPGYIALKKQVADPACESFIEAHSSVDLFMLHRSLVAEYPIQADERYSIDEIIEAAEDLLKRRDSAVQACDEVRHGHTF